ncbi:MAG TPA: class I fructose-bisphosphate aldolase [Tepidisphaeraceae bacterium]|nr:class I fructose-bisphosphate aldolase [Tepidisphaeraceae bacterium]
MIAQEKLIDGIRQLKLATRCLHAADESGGNIAKKFQQLDIEDTAENRIAYRGAMFTTAGYGDVIGGVILFDETFRQTYEGKTVTDILKQEGIVIGVKVDSGLQPFGNSKIEEVGKNELAALPKRMEEYAAKNVRFTKFRVAANIGRENGKALPSDECLAANAGLLAEYAEICHRFGVVPIVEPEVPMEGRHTLEDSQQATTRFLKATFAALRQRNIFLPGVILKTNMVLSGLEGPKASEADCVRETVSTLEAMTPSNIGAVVFLSGGQTTSDAMRRLEEIRKAAKEKRLPFTLSSSFSRALQEPALEEFGAAIRDRASAADIKRRTQEKFAEALKLNGMALKRSV